MGDHRGDKIKRPMRHVLSRARRQHRADIPLLRGVKRHEVDRLQDDVGKAAFPNRIGNDRTREGKQKPRRFDEKKQLDLVFR